MSPVRYLASAVVACLIIGACQPSAPSLGPSPPAAAPVPTAVVSAAPPSKAASRLGDELRDAIDPADILADLEELQSIADSNGGTRSAGSRGHEASVDFVERELRAAGFDVTLQPVTLAAFSQDSASVLSIDGTDGPTFDDIRDFKAMLFSASGDVRASVFALGFDPAAKPGDRNGLGCNAADWVGVPAGAIVLAQPGQCRRHDMVAMAQVAGAVAVVTSYPEWSRDRVLRPTLVQPDDIEIPVLGATPAVGLALAQAAADGIEVHVVARTSFQRVASMNVIGETPGGDPAHVVMLGGHLDSVVDGPGINDNGSGTMTVLEIAREVAAFARDDPAALPWKVRVGFWTGEEIGLLGSAAYVNELDGADAAAIQAYLNFDMLGSPNGVRAVYDAQGSSSPDEDGIVERLFTAALDAGGLSWELEAIGAASDHFPFDQAGIAIGGLFSGASEIKSAAQAAEFGGVADASQDACYHRGCDTAENIDPVLLEQLARAAAWVVGRLASGEVALTSS
jgi:Zn-dependent M28 family amino/carboxypeptidase